MFNHHKHRKHPKFMKEIQKFTSYNYSKPKTYKCSVIGCNMVFENSAYVKDHMNIHKTLACFYCHSKFISQEKLDIHFRVCGVNSEFCCHICQVGFKTKAYLSNHQRLIHQVQKKIVIYPPSLNHNRHITIEDDACYEEHDESNQDIESVNEDYGDSTVKQEIEICYNCIECGNMYDEETEYRDHMITHTNS